MANQLISEYTPDETPNTQISKLEEWIERLITLRNSLEADSDFEPETLEPWHVPNFRRGHVS